MAEELTMEQQAKALFDILSSKDISPDDLAKASGIIKANPKILTNESFVSNIKMPDFASMHAQKVDLGQMLYEGAKSQKDLKVVLDNLAKIDLPMYGKTMTVEGKKRTAANYFLDNAYLPNGEIIGTQTVKNMHFMGNVLKDKPEPIYKDDSKNQEAKRAVHAHLEQTAPFYAGLYTAYGANHNARNFSGQKVDQLMDAYLAENKPEKKRANTTVENKPKQATTLAQAKENIYRGNATAEDKKLVQENEDKEAELANVDDPRNKYSGYNHKGEKFRDEDVIKYMYEEWFLALLSWGCDKIEEGIEIAIDYTTDGLRALSVRQEKDAKETKNQNLKPVKAKVASFGHETDGLLNNFTKNAPLYAQRFINLKKDLQNIDFAAITHEQERQLREKYGDNLISAFKADPKKLDSLKKLSEQGIENIAGNIKAAGQCAMMLTRLEMVDEMMRSDKKWRDSLTGAYLSDDELIAGDKGFIERSQKRMEKIMIAVRTLSEDARGLAKAEYGKLTTKEEKEAWIKKNISDEYDALINNPETSDERRQSLRKDLVKFEKKYKAGMLDEEIYQTYSSLKVNTYLDEMVQKVQKATQKQAEFVDNERFNAISRAPNDDVKDIIDEADKETEKIIDKGVGYTKFFGKKQAETPAKRTLEEEAISYTIAMPLEVMAEDLKNPRGPNSVQERMRRVKEAKANNPLNTSRLLSGTTLGLMGYDKKER